MTTIERSLPIHLDGTSLLGAALATETSELKKGILPLSRLLSLSQFVEALVFHDSLQFEMAATPEWDKFRATLEGTEMYRLVRDLNVPLRRYDGLTDESDAAVLKAASWATGKALLIAPEVLEHAVRPRINIYSNNVTKIVDEKNPITLRYWNLIRNDGGEKLRRSMSKAMARMKRINVGPMGIHVLLRIKMLEGFFVARNTANYFPHFSRQPLVAAAADDNGLYEHKVWMMNGLSKKSERGQRVKDSTSVLGLKTEALDVRLSPVLLACIARAKRPADILVQALSIRESRAAKKFRGACRNACISGSVDNGLRFKQHIRVIARNEIEALNDLLAEYGVKGEWRAKSNCYEAVPRDAFSPKYSTLFRSFRFEDKPGAKAGIFVKNVLHDAMGILAAQQRILEVFGVSVSYDEALVV